MNQLRSYFVNSYGKCPKYWHQLSCVYIQKRQNNDLNYNKINTNNTIGVKLNNSEESLIYSGPQTMVKMIKMIKTFSISTTLIACGVQPFIYQQILSTSSSFAIGFASVTSFGIVLSPLVLNWITKRYVTQLYYNYETKEYKAWVLNLFNRRVSINYKAEEVTVPEVLGIFTTFTVGSKKRPLFVDPNFVIDLNAYKTMLGYDKPIDLKLDRIMTDDNHSKSK